MQVVKGILYCFIFYCSLCIAHTDMDRFTFLVQERDDATYLKIHIAPEHYLYKDKLELSLHDGSIQVKMLPEGILHQDPLFGETEVYTQQIEIPIEWVVSHGGEPELIVAYQGCTDSICYPPETITLPLSVNNDLDIISSQTQPQTMSIWALLAYFGLGLGIAFTPCLYPMYPILLGSLAHTQNRGKSSFKYAFWYVHGMAITYCSLGLVVSTLGLGLQAYLQHPIILTALSLLFILMAGSLLGWYSFNMPQSWSNRVHHLSEKIEKKNAWGALLMGFLAGFICSPCTTAPLSAALLYITQTGNQTLGILALYLMSLGMGGPLLAMGLGYQRLPRSGSWLEFVPKVMGAFLLVVPVFLWSRFLPSTWIQALTIATATYIFFFLWRQLAVGHKVSLKRGGVGIVLSMAWLFVVFYQIDRPTVSSQDSVFMTIHQPDELAYHLKRAQKNQKNLVLDLTADWCPACHIMEQETFTDPVVRAYLSEQIAVRFDLSQSSKEVQLFLKKHNITGIPALLVFAPDQTQPVRRIVGLQSPSKLISLLEERPSRAETLAQIHS